MPTAEWMCREGMETQPVRVPAPASAIEPASVAPPSSTSRWNGTSARAAASSSRRVRRRGTAEPIVAAGAQSKYLIAGPPPSRIGSWRNSVAGVSPASVTSSAMATSGWTRNAAGPGAAQPELLLDAGHRHDGCGHVALGEPPHGLDHHRAAGAIVDGLAREHARAVERHARAHERDRVADAHAQRLGLLTAGRAQVDEHVMQRDRLPALLGATACAGFVPTTPITEPFSP